MSSDIIWLDVKTSYRSLQSILEISWDEGTSVVAIRCDINATFTQMVMCPDTQAVYCTAAGESVSLHTDVLKRTRAECYSVLFRTTRKNGRLRLE